MKYKSFYNSETEKYEFIPVYEIDRNIMFDGITGEKKNLQVKSNRFYLNNYNSSMKEEVSADSAVEEDGKIFLSEQEIAEVEKYSNLLSINQVLNSLSESKMFFNNINYEINSYNYKKRSYPKNININFEGNFSNHS